MALLALFETIALPTGVLLACRRFGSRNVTPVAALPLAAALLGVIDAEPASFFAMAPLVGLIAAVQVERQRSYGQVIAAASAPGLVLGLMLMSYIDEWVQNQDALNQALSQLEGVQSPQDIEAIRVFMFTAVRLLPGFSFVSILLAAVLSYRLSQFVAERTGLSVPPAPLMRTWRLWDQLIWVLIGGMGLWLIGSGTVEDFALNLLTVMLILYAAQGVSVARYAVWRMGISRLVEVLFYTVLLATAPLLLVGVGLMDTWFDWRRLAHRAEPSGGDSQ